MCERKDCDGQTLTNTIREDGDDYEIWYCSKDPYHWGSKDDS